MSHEPCILLWGWKVTPGKIKMWFLSHLGVIFFSDSLQTWSCCWVELSWITPWTSADTYWWCSGNIPAPGWLRQMERNPITLKRYNRVQGQGERSVNEWLSAVNHSNADRSGRLLCDDHEALRGSQLISQHQRVNGFHASRWTLLCSEKMTRLWIDSESTQL